jgi:hypothetical protein
MNTAGTSVETVKAVTLKLLAYCQDNDWAGYDPYDALNSKLFQLLPFLDYKVPRLILTQLLKRCPVNPRRLLLIPKTQNAKGLALFLSATLRLSKLGLARDELVGEIAPKIAALRSPGIPYWCWGYSFAWQTRTIFVPRYAPNLVCTTFVANALLDAYEAFGESRYLTMARSAAEYILNELYWSEGEFTAGYRYPFPTSREPVHNANFLGAALLCRVYRHCGEQKFLDSALKVARYSASRQQSDGSWYYGEHDNDLWIDNFHTGYNLCALRDIGIYSQTQEFESCVHRGFEFYCGNFFSKDGAPKYFHNRTYPIDIHSVAQSIITLTTFKALGEDCVALAHAVLRWAMDHLLDGRGYFYYQVLPYFRVKIPFMRWSQAWMLLALSVLCHVELPNLVKVNSKEITVRKAVADYRAEGQTRLNS